MNKKIVAVIIAALMLLVGCDGETVSSGISTAVSDESSASSAPDRVSEWYDADVTAKVASDFKEFMITDAYLMGLGFNHALYAKKGSDFMEYKFQIFCYESDYSNKTVLLYEFPMWESSSEPNFVYNLSQSFLRVRCHEKTMFFGIDPDTKRDSALIHVYVLDDTFFYADELSNEPIFVLKYDLERNVYVTDAFTDEIYLKIPFPEGFSGAEFVSRNEVCIYSEKPNGKTAEKTYDIPSKGTGKIMEPQVIWDWETRDAVDRSVIDG